MSKLQQVFFQNIIFVETVLFDNKSIHKLRIAILKIFRLECFEILDGYGFFSCYLKGH